MVPLASRPRTFVELFFSPAEIEKTTAKNLQRWLSRSWTGLREEDACGLSLRSFLQNHEEFIRRALWSIREARYVPFPGVSAWLEVDKPRPYVKRSWIDRWLLNHLGRIYGDVVEPLLSPNLRSYRTGMGSHSAQREFSTRVRGRAKVYVFRSDVRSYSEQVSQELIIQDFLELAAPGAELEQLFRCLVFPCFENGDEAYPGGVGLPLGSHLTCVVNNLYLRHLDETLSALEGGFYRRYSDDLLYAHDTEAEILKAAELVESELKKRKLELKREKTFFLCLLNPCSHPAFYSDIRVRASSGIAYLGKTLTWEGRALLPTEKWREILTILKGAVQRAEKRIPASASLDERVSILCQTLQKLFADFAQGEHPRFHGLLQELRDHEQLRQLQRLMAEEILRAAHRDKFSRSRFSKGRFRFFPPKVLRERGLPDLLKKRRQREF